MRQHTKVGVGLLLLAGCGKELPGFVPEFRIEVAFDKRAESAFCFAPDDDPNGGKVVEDITFAPLDDPTNLEALSTKLPDFPNLQVAGQDDTCLRFTVLKADGDFVLSDAQSSSCAIRLDESKVDAGEPIAFILKTAGEGALLNPDEEYSMRLDFFQKGANGEPQLIQSAFAAPFTLQDDGEDQAIDQTLTFFQDEHLSCIAPPSFNRENETIPLGDFRPEDFTTLNDARAFHSATAVGDPAVGESQGVVVAGGATTLLKVGAGGTLSNTIEVFDKRTMRFTRSDTTLLHPRAFHDAVAFAGQGGLLQVALVGGTTRAGGVGFGVKPFGFFENPESPLPVLPFPTATDLTFVGYDDEVDAANPVTGIEVINLDQKTLAVIDTFSIDTPGRFGAATALVGEQLFYFGGLATTPNQTCGSLTVTLNDLSTRDIPNFLCSDSFVVTRNGTNQADFVTGAGPTLTTSRIGASAAAIGNTHVLLVGGNVENAAAFAELVDVAANTSAPLALDPAGFTDTTTLRRAFFALSPVPGQANQFVMFGGEKLQNADNKNRLVAGPNAVTDPFGPKNFAALLTVDVGAGTINVTPILGASVDVPLSRPFDPTDADGDGQADAANADVNLEVLKFAGGNNTNPIGLAQSDAFLEDRNIVEFGAFADCNNTGGQDCLSTNLGERIVFPIVLPGPNNTLLFMSGARGGLFPQDQIVSFDPVNNTLTELDNPNSQGNKLHLFRRSLGLRGVFLPGFGGGDMLLLTGGLTGLAFPRQNDPNAQTFQEFLPDSARHDVSYFVFNTPQDSVDDVCSFADDDTITTESAVCGFANKQLQDNFIEKIFK